MSSYEITGTGCSGTFGGDMFTMGETVISPSDTHHRKNCWRLRYRIAAVVALVPCNSSAAHASTCSRRIESTDTGIPVDSRDQRSARRRTGRWRSSAAPIGGVHGEVE